MALACPVLDTGQALPRTQGERVAVGEVKAIDLLADRGR